MTLILKILIDFRKYLEIPGTDTTIMRESRRILNENRNEKAIRSLDARNFVDFELTRDCKR